MYYKIENKDCVVYKKLHELRAKEEQMEENNIKAIKEKTGLDWENSFGKRGQQNFRRVSSYSGFGFTEPEKVDLKIWKQHKGHIDIFIPNTRTKAGREMEQFLNNGLEGGRFDDVLEILNLEHLRKFTFPFVEIVGESIIMYLDDDHEPKDSNIIEITKREFNEYRSHSL